MKSIRKEIIHQVNRIMPLLSYYKVEKNQLRNKEKCPTEYKTFINKKFYKPITKILAEPKDV